MAETGEGCSGCHHYDQAGPIQKCSACHSATRVRTDLGKPDVKAAMHRQCMECHLEWNPAAKCATCHEQSGKAGSAAAAALVKAPKATAPVRVVYQTRTVEGKTVTFFHNDHVSRFGLDCASCHQRESCATCHRVKPGAPASATMAARPAGKQRTAAEAHARCSACHATTGRCATCHATSEAKVAGFDHKSRTGWTLNRFHAPLACVQCHSAAPVCTSCHADKTYPADKPGQKVVRPLTRK